MSGHGDENEAPNHRRSSRARKQRNANPCDFLDDEDAPGAPTSRSSSSSKSSSNTSNNPTKETRLAKPPTDDRWRHWSRKTMANIDEFSTVDRRDITYTRRSWWGGYQNTSLCVSYIMPQAEKELVADQDPQDVALEVEDLETIQVPYHADLLPYYEYFAEGIQQHSIEMESFRISNFHLPPAPWFGDNILPTLETTSIAELVLSNCSLAGEELASVAKFLHGNTTLYSLDLSKNNIESAETVKLLAKAMKKKNSAIRHVNLGHTALGGDKGALEKLLDSLKKCESLEIGHEDMDSEAVKSMAKFLGKKNALTSFSLVGARLDKESKKAMEQALVKNKTIEELCLRSNGLALPSILRSTKKAMKSLSRLTHLELSFNSLPVQGAKSLAKFLENSECELTSLILAKNNLTTKGANVLLPALKENTSLEVLDLSRNWLNDAVAPAVVDLLLNNSTLLSLDLTGNKSLKSNSQKRYQWRRDEGYVVTREMQERGKAEIVKGALFDTTSLQAIANSNHTCAVHLSGQNSSALKEETIRKINELDVSDGVKIRYKVVLAITEVNKDLYDPRSFNDIPLELMPYLLQLVQQELGCNGFGIDDGIIKTNKKDRGYSAWMSTTDPAYDPARPWCRRKYIADPSLSNVYEIIMGWQSLPLLFVNGAGELPKKKKKAKQPTKKKGRKRPRKFGDEDDSDDDEPYIPNGARKTARWEYQDVREADGSLRRKYVCIPPPVY